MPYRSTTISPLGRHPEHTGGVSSRAVLEVHQAVFPLPVGALRVPSCHSVQPLGEDPSRAVRVVAVKPPNLHMEANRHHSHGRSAIVRRYRANRWLLVRRETNKAKGFVSRELVRRREQ